MSTEMPDVAAAALPLEGVLSSEGGMAEALLGVEGPAAAETGAVGDEEVASDCLVSSTLDRAGGVSE
jgi:hypothetical protein